MHFVPIPTHIDALRKTREHWLPFLPVIAESQGEPLEGLLDQIFSGFTHIGVVWDGEKAHALAGWHLRRGGKVAEIIWIEGVQRENWQHLLPELEKYLTEHLKVDVIRPIARPGWTRLLKRAGYKLTHCVMEKNYV
jgi:hypothetical protein